MVRAIWASFLGDDQGQGLAEYCLAAAFIALVALGLYVHVSGGMKDLWTTANSALVTGNSTSTGGATASVGAH
jgi:Flp pilus assembly pilin Flp